MKSQVLSALANPVRLKLIICLSRGSKNVTELIGSCGLSQSAVSQHLEKLRTAGLVTTNRGGKEIYYALKDKETAKVGLVLQNFLKEV